MKCGLCHRNGATLRVQDAANQDQTVHRACWLELQAFLGQVSREMTSEQRKTTKWPEKA